MKKNIISFVVFVFAFIGSLGFIYYKTNPTIRLNTEQEQLEWHGHIENEYGTYDGALINDIFNGEGRFLFLSGETYAGTWQDSYMSGTGEVLFPRVGEYRGDMNNSMRSGHGVFTWVTGESYDGNWQNDEMFGEGTYTFTNGMTLTGIFQNNTPVSGTLSYSDKPTENDLDTKIVHLVYSFSESEKTIVFYTKGGLKYDGDLSGLFERGMAEITYPSGNTYTGQLLKGQRNGIGKYVWKDSSGKTLSYYEGSWVVDQMNGDGKYHFSNLEYPYLSGNFEDGMPSGTLVYYKSNGNTFETEWQNGTCVSIEET